MNWRFGLLLVPALAWSQAPPTAPIPYVDAHVHPLAGSLNPMIHDTAAQPVDAALRERFAARARKILADGAAGFGEMSPHHLAARPGHPYESVLADHPLFLLLADIAAEHGAVIDLHFDLVATETTLPAVFSAALNPAVLRANLAGFERLLAHNRGARVVRAHAGADPLGQWTPRLSRELLARHPNLYMSIRMGGGQPRMQNLMLHSGGGIDPQWRARSVTRTRCASAA